jgi:hypothetical protein
MSKQYKVEIVGDSVHDGFVVATIEVSDGVRGKKEQFIAPGEVCRMLMEAINIRNDKPRSVIDDMRAGVFEVRPPAASPRPLPQDDDGERGQPDGRRAAPAQPTPRQPRQTGQAPAVEPVATLRRERERDREPAPNTRAARAAAIGSREGGTAERVFDREANVISLRDLVDSWTDDKRLNRDMVEREVAKVGRQAALRFVRATKPTTDFEERILSAISKVADGRDENLSVAATAKSELRRDGRLRTDTRDVEEGNRAGLVLPDPKAFIPDNEEDDAFGAFGGEDDDRV